MSKVACIWCESGNASPKKGYWWICDVCLQQHFERVLDLKAFMDDKAVNPDFETWWKHQLQFMRKYKNVSELLKGVR